MHNMKTGGRKGRYDTVLMSGILSASHVLDKNNPLKEKKKGAEKKKAWYLLVELGS